jgi:probable H4MPT-linked C1 transfer pathway protein
MTAELCDCYRNKAEGVSAILDAVERVADGRSVSVWQTTGQWADVCEARLHWVRTASANWHALATYASRIVDNHALMLFDIGSTTSDLIPVLAGRPLPWQATDLSRLRARQLVYTGVGRTPFHAVLPDVHLEGETIPLATELFATTRDVYLILGMLLEDANNCDTADGRPATREASFERVARMLCADVTMVSREQLRSLAEQARARQIENLADAFKSVRAALPESCEPNVVLSGSGEFLAREVLGLLNWHGPITSLSERLGAERSSAACAFALAQLAATVLPQTNSTVFLQAVELDTLKQVVS